jgi:hypothetical protein
MKISHGRHIDVLRSITALIKAIHFSIVYYSRSFQYLTFGGASVAPTIYDHASAMLLLHVIIL